MPEPGFVVIHANQLETLRELLVQWLSKQPVPVLGTEQILVQSNGIAQWLKMALAETANGHPGIAAGLKVELPNQFVWQLYRAVLGDSIPTSLPYDKINLSWRLLGLLPQLTDAVFQPLQRYLQDDSDGRKSYQLALRLADLFDQYQVYRADWLQSWRSGSNILPNSKKQQVPDDQLWQPALWRLLQSQLASVVGELAFSSRADVHTMALTALQQGKLQRPDLLPDRIVVFGVSSLPQQTVELLAALGAQRQVLLTVLNPCRHFWGDITHAKDEIRAAQQRHGRKPGLPPVLDTDALYLHAPVLLASLGKQGRDYISLLDGFDQSSRYQHWFNGRIDLFSDPVDDISQLPLLAQLQQDILELNPTPQPPRQVADGDSSISFHIAHSRQREVEILQDNLIAAFAADPTLKPRDVIIMTPDISLYQSHVHAVFGRLAQDDARFLPYTLADQSLRGSQPLMLALEYLLDLPSQRFSLSEVCDLLDVPAIQRRFAINSEALPQLRLWLTEAGVRWGLDAQQRASLDLAAPGDSYSWMFAIERMLLGFAIGDVPLWQGRAPYAEVAGLAAAELGPLLQFIQQLKRWHLLLTGHSARELADWQQLLLSDNGLLHSLFDFSDEQDQLIYARLSQGLAQLVSAAHSGDFNGKVQLAVLRDAWLEQAGSSGLSQRFFAGSLTFSTLMPMRAIPFKRIYLLGLNDGDYPRSRMRDDFDLMAGDYRPGDRSRRDDDRYLFLEALLSAREVLYLSWVGRDIRNNSELPPSVLLSQLLDLLDSGWQHTDGDKPSVALCHSYPLQPFSRQYFNGNYATYAHEWQAAHEAMPAIVANSSVQPELPLLTLRLLDDFLANPCRHYLQQRFKTRFYQSELASDDAEPFVLNALELYQLKQQLLEQLLAEPQLDVDAAMAQLAREAKLPLALFGSLTGAQIGREANVVFARYRAGGIDWQRRATPLRLELNPAGIALHDSLTNVYQSPAGQLALLQLRPTAIRNKGELRWHTLRTAWLQQLAANAGGEAVSTYQYGLDDAVQLLPQQQRIAAAQLDALVQYWQQGLTQPLPLLPKTALCFVQTQDEAKCRELFEGGYNFAGEVESAPELQRYYPDFASLLQAGFADWAQKLYGPLLQTPLAEQANQEADA
ncbi:DNA helicase/exodeoxyribonuclease V, gamma subunit [Rheinheimera pacifica]|uniref:RecBCD enzyme subunit RecC n=1 Tax=Rheinheimera pacifica TaxID=173990 RepID=A0A1H6JD26_9GAMM|nr:exodeoxyribonuclease V subunit gamma [Rheinheimera pacifica]SEH56752.1 DNA helicase/exodeoxyribonuclease V, gamma subunit [Rheinheimera pacifica]